MILCRQIHDKYKEKKRMQLLSLQNTSKTSKRDGNLYTTWNDL